MVLSALFITDLKGKPLIYRNYRGQIPLSITEEFRTLLIDNEESTATPIIYHKEVSFCFVEHKDLLILGVTRTNSNVFQILTLLFKIVSVFEDYFGELEQESIRDNFVIIYELLDEMCDFGYPQVTEPKTLQSFICVKEKHRLQIQSDAEEAKKAAEYVTGGVSWRKRDCHYKKNEVFLDCIEKLNLSINNNGDVLHSEILGCLRMKVYLSGMPELKLGLNDKLMMEKKKRRRSNSSKKSKTVEMDDITFHNCVRLSRFETDRTISFIPPDGEFDLMTYRLDTPVKPLIFVEAHRDFRSHSRVEYMIKCRSEFKRRSTANNVQIIIPVPTDVDSPQFKTSIGSVQYIPENNQIKWKIKQLQGQKEYLMKAHFGLPSITVDDAGQSDNLEYRASSEGSSKEPIHVHFEIPYFTVSGIQVRYLKIVEKSGYQALPWVRYITQNGTYSIRV